MPSFLIRGYRFSLPSHYGEAQPMTAGEASALESTRIDRLRDTNFVDLVRDAELVADEGLIGDEQLEALQAELLRRDSEFEFQPRQLDRLGEIEEETLRVISELGVGPQEARGEARRRINARRTAAAVGLSELI